MHLTPPISKFASTPKPWAAFTNFSISVTLLRCSMNYSLISLHASSRLLSIKLPLNIWMMTPIIRTPLYLLSTPMIRPISLEISKMMIVQFHYQRTSKRHRD